MKQGWMLTSAYRGSSHAAVVVMGHEEGRMSLPHDRLLVASARRE